MFTALLLLAGTSWIEAAPARAAVLPAETRSLVSELESGKVDCSFTYLIGTSKLAPSAADMRRASRILNAPNPGDGEAFIARRVIDRVTPSLSEAQLTLADGLLRNQCLTEADTLYRELLDFYSGRAFASLRERVLVGIEDVRQAKAQSSN